MKGKEKEELGKKENRREEDSFNNWVLRSLRFMIRKRKNGEEEKEKKGERRG